MCTPALMNNAAPIGAASTVLGTGLNAYGQHQAGQAMAAALDGQAAVQRAYAAQLAQRMSEMTGKLNPQMLLGQAQATQQAAQSAQAAQQAAQAVGKQGKTRTKGARAGAETQAMAAQGQQATLGRALKDGKLQAKMQGMTQGLQGVDLLGRGFGVDAGRIRGDAAQWAKLSPIQQRAAGMAGGEARQLGTGLNQLGQFGMMYGMTQERDPLAKYLSPPEPGLGDAGATDLPSLSDLG